MAGRRNLAIVLVVLVMGLGVAVTWAGPFIARDRCLDAGGAWRDGRCVR